MGKTASLPGTTIKLEDLLLKWEGVITPLVTLCAVLAIVIGIVWMFLRRDIFLFIVLGFSSCYFIGRNFWRFRPQRFPVEN
jgi:hypothetical protein